MTTKPKATPGPYSVVKYVVNERGQEVGSLAAGHLQERLRIVAVDDYGAGPILADMVVGGRATADLMAAAPEMLDALEPHSTPPGPDFLELVAARLVMHGDDPNADFILALQRKAARARAAIAKAEGR